MPDASILHISPLALSEADFVMLQTAIERLVSEDDIPCRLLARNDPHGHLTVIDPETAEGQAMLARLRPGQVKLLLTGSAQSGKNIISLKKPVQQASLQQILRHVCQQMLAQLQRVVPSSQTPQPASASPETPIANVPADTSTRPGLLPVLLQARKERQLLHIKWDNQELFVDGQQYIYATLAPADSLQVLLQAPLESVQVRKLSPTEAMPGHLGSAINGLENLLWEAGLACDDGLPEGIESDSRIQLKAWPNFTRHGFHPEHFKIAALLAQRAGSYDELLQQAGISAAGIYSFIQACHAVDLIVEASHAPASVKQRSSRTPERKGILNRIAQRLGIAFA
jgi:hypothetical protein